MSVQYDCTRCGACCFSANPHYVRLLPQDALRILPEGTTHDHQGERYLTMGCGRCAFLAISPEGLSLCGIYDNRPEACRAFRAGSFECLMARKHKGAEAEAARFSAIAIVPGDPPAEIPAFIAAEALPAPARGTGAA